MPRQVSNQPNLFPAIAFRESKQFAKRHFTAGRECFNSLVSLEELDSLVAVKMLHGFHFLPFSTK